MTPERFAKLKRVLGRRQPDLTVLADDVHKSHNISAVLRSADAVGLHRLHAVSPGGAMRRHHMISGGARRWVDVVVHPTMEIALDTLHRAGWYLAAAHPSGNARDFRDIDYTRKIAIVLGGELDGLGKAAIERADVTITVPMHGMVSSLNVSVAAAIILYEVERQRSAAGLYERVRLDTVEFQRTLFEWTHPEIAERCRRRGRPYPELREDGSLANNPLAVEGGS